MSKDMLGPVVRAHGHVVFTITGLDLIGEQEIERLEKNEFCIDDYAKQMLKSAKPDGYDAKHHLIAGQQYKVVFIPGKEIARDSDRTTKNLQKLAEKYRYEKPLGGIIPRIREIVSDKQRKKWISGTSSGSTIQSRMPIATRVCSVRVAVAAGGGSTATGFPPTISGTTLARLPSFSQQVNAWNFILAFGLRIALSRAEPFHFD